MQTGSNMDDFLSSLFNISVQPWLILFPFFSDAVQALLHPNREGFCRGEKKIGGNTKMDLDVHTL